CNHIGVHLFCDIVDCPSAKTAAHVAAVIGLFLNQAETRLVAHIEPFHVSFLQILAKRGNRCEKLTLLDGKGTDLEVDWRTLLQQKQRFQERNGVFSTGQSDCYTVSIADHVETLDRLPHFS